MNSDEKSNQNPDSGELDIDEQTKAAAATIERQHHFTIKTAVFEGPLDLLLTLIEKRKLFISDISLAKVTDEYVAHIDSLPEYSLKHRAQFILIASTLLLIKAKSLLPALELTEEEESDISDLEVRLKILNLIRKQSGYVREIFGTNKIYERGDMEEMIRIFAPSKDISQENIINSIRQVLQTLPKENIEPKATIKKIVSLEEMMDNLGERIQKAMKLTFREFSRTKQDHEDNRSFKVHVIVSFLAMLELVKQGSLDVRQDKLFDEIEMESNNDISTPRY